ncbi:MAG: hypothetical protein Q8P63_01135 [Candidatus Nealsonbacteria bacterium]|nr:hypothetical protein [Candidatus Nealsonbacteria bacterium]
MTPDLILHIFSLFIFCLVLAALEVQIEGEAGWASNLPTWRPRQNAWHSRFYRKIMSGRDLTGYHLFIFSLVLFFLHYPYFVNQSWSFSSELTTLSFAFLVIVVWDFLWFVINPKYDFRHFWAQHVWWHKKWFLHLPVDYWFGFLLSAIFYMKLSLDWALLKEWLAIFVLILFLTLIVIIIANAAGVFRLKKNDNKK